jgi:allophanate hydrolase
MIPRMLQISRLAEAYRAGSLDPLALVEEVLARRAACSDPAVWIAPVPDNELRARARALLSMPRGPLWGIPFAVKDNIDVAGMDTTAGCPAFAVRAERHATVVAKLLHAGAILIGKTNLDQFATGLVGTRSPHGAPRSVFSRAHVSGGSSSGSAVAVASGLVSFALGTDTAGSGRVPAAFNNLVGLKPTKGLLSTSGVVPACRSQDCVSIFALDSADALQVMGVAAGYDATDPFSRPAQPVALPQHALRVGVLPPEQRQFDGDAEAAGLYDAAIDRARRLGFEPVLFDFAPFLEAAKLLYGGALVAERTTAVGDFVSRHPEAIDPTVRTIIEGGRAFSAADLFRDQHRLRALARDAEREWARFDIMLLPTTPTAATVEELAADPIGRNALLGTYTNFVNLLDHAAIAIPAGFRSDGMSLGITLVGPAFSDAALAHVADRMHGALGGFVGAGPELAAPLADLPAQDGRIAVAVAGAHLTGMPLNHELVSLGGTLRASTRTSPDYALYALAGTVPPKPGLVRRPSGPVAGVAIEVEVWELSPEGFGRFVAGIPAPLGIGKVTLADGSSVPGFICEPGALEGAADISAYGGWKAFRAASAG